MKMLVMTMIACSLLIGAAMAQENSKAQPAAAGGGALDGKVFAGELGKSGEKKGNKDELTFKGGMFVSAACVAYGFHETAYTTTEKDGVVTFTASPTKAKGETMSWTGTIKDGVLEGAAVNRASSGETTYWFKGAAGSAAKIKEPKKKSEHPEHPK